MMFLSLVMYMLFMFSLRIISYFYSYIITYSIIFILSIIYVYQNPWQFIYVLFLLFSGKLEFKIIYAYLKEDYIKHLEYVIKNNINLDADFLLLIFSIIDNEDIELYGNYPKKELFTFIVVAFFVIIIVVILGN